MDKQRMIFEIDRHTVTEGDVTASASKTVSDPRITGDMEVVRAVLSNPAAQQGDWTVTTVTGSLTITGAISGQTGVVLYLARTIN